MDSKNNDKGDGSNVASSQRRTVLKAAVGVSLGLPLVELAEAAKKPKPPNKMRPQPDDIVVFRFNERKGEAVKPEDVVLGQQLIQAVTMDPESKVMRDGSRLNGINLVRLEPEQLDEKTEPYTVDGIVAYSSVCNHQGCDLTQWLPDTYTFKCYCHYSQFDARNLGQPVEGPSKRKLALLPLKLEDDVLKVAGKFVGRVGFKR